MKLAELRRLSSLPAQLTDYKNTPADMKGWHKAPLLQGMVYHAQPVGSAVPRSSALEATSAAIYVDNKDNSLPNDQTKDVYQRCTPKKNKEISSH